MSIELTTASKSTRLGVLSALNAGIWGIPLFDGFSYQNKAEVIYSDEATEGTSIPDGASDTFTKTYNLTRSYPTGAVVQALNNEGGMALNLLANPKLARVITEFPHLSCTSDYIAQYSNVSFFGYLAGSDALGVALLIYVNNDYTQAVKLFANSSTTSYGPLDDSGNLLYNYQGSAYGKNYTQLNNILAGYYSGPFSKASFFIAKDGSNNVAPFILQSAYLDGSSLKFLFKKAGATSSSVLKRGGVLVVDASI
jgi:hypothetical protein